MDKQRTPLFIRIQDRAFADVITRTNTRSGASSSPDGLDSVRIAGYPADEITNTPLASPGEYIGRFDDAQRAVRFIPATKAAEVLIDTVL